MTRSFKLQQLLGVAAVPAGNELFLVGHATGVQIYACNAIDGRYRWALVAPRANVYDNDGKLVATHFAGPTWQATDGSTVVGRRIAAVTVDRTAIDWLLLAAASTASGREGDRLAGTTFIQRLNTAGGLAPPTGHCRAATAGARAEVPYTADYSFWKASDA
jgi:hypothetical protein